MPQRSLIAMHREMRSKVRARISRSLTGGFGGIAPKFAARTPTFVYRYTHVAPLSGALVRRNMTSSVTGDAPGSDNRRSDVQVLAGSTFGSARRYTATRGSVPTTCT